MEDINEKIRRLTAQMKRQQEWQTTAAKKGKKVVDTSATLASIEAKTSMAEKLLSQEKSSSPLANQGTYIDVK